MKLKTLMVAPSNLSWTEGLWTHFWTTIKQQIWVKRGFFLIKAKLKNYSKPINWTKTTWVKDLANNRNYSSHSSSPWEVCLSKRVSKKSLKAHKYSFPFSYHTLVYITINILLFLVINSHWWICESVKAWIFPFSIPDVTANPKISSVPQRL